MKNRAESAERGRVMGRKITVQKRSFAYWVGFGLGLGFFTLLAVAAVVGLILAIRWLLGFL